MTDCVLLLHGSAGTSAQWRELRGRLAASRRVFAPDLIGYGSSAPWPERKDFALTDEVRELLPRLSGCTGGIDVVGYSYGGAVALALAEALPNRIRSLTLIEPVFFAALRYAGEAAAHADFMRVRTRFDAELARGAREAAMRGFIEFWTGSGSWEMLDPAVRASLIGLSAKIRLDWNAAFDADPGLPLLDRLGPRALLVRGDRSPAPMRTLVDALHGLMPGSRRIVVPGADHLLPLRHGPGLTEALVAHWRTSPAAGASPIPAQREPACER